MRRLRRPGVNNIFVGCHRLGLCKVYPQGAHEKNKEEELEAEKEQPHEESVRGSLLDEVGVLYFVAKAREAFRRARRD